MPEPGPTRTLSLAADLHLSVVGARGQATAHVHGWSNELVVDVDRPDVLLRQLTVRGRQRPMRVLRLLIADTPVRVRSGEHNLARVRLTSAGKLRVRPTFAGLGTVIRALVPARLVQVGARHNRG